MPAVAPGLAFRVHILTGAAFGAQTIMPKQTCLIVRAAGKELDLLRAEASRIAKENKVDWHIDHAKVGTLFCFENDKAKEAFALTCDNFGVPCQTAKGTPA